jgi:hypothetical protein
MWTVKKLCRTCIWRKVPCEYPEYIDHVTLMAITPANQLTSDLVRDWDGPLGDILTGGFAELPITREDQVDPEA